MPTIVDPSALTINEEEIKELGQIIIEEEIINSNLSIYHDIVTGVNVDKQILFASSIGDALTIAENCTPTAVPQSTLSEKFWRPRILSFRQETCSDQITQNFKPYFQMKQINPGFYDQISDERWKFAAGIIGNMLWRNLHNLVWFNDLNADTIANGGSLTNGTNVDLYNHFNGLFVQIFSEVTGSNYVEITQNAGVSYAAQRLTPQQAFDYISDVYNAADPRLLMEANFKNASILATTSVCRPYRQYLRENNLGAGFLEATVNGIPQLKFEGIPVIERPDWDTFINLFLNNGTVWEAPNRIVFTTKDNIPVGTLSTGDFEMFDSFYERYRKANVLDVALSLDAKFLQSYKCVAAY